VAQEWIKTELSRNTRQKQLHSTANHVL